MSVDHGDGDAIRSCVVRTTIQPTDRLYLPHRKRISHEYVTNLAGAREFYIYYGTKEVSFDEARLFGFGEELVRQSVFTAEAATGWGPGYDWPEVRALLEALVAEGIVQLGDAGDDMPRSGLVPALVGPAVCPVPRSWTADDCESITRDLAGRAVEFGYLEAIMPVYRLAHPALDGDGRQVGEANVFPPALRLDRDTEWRVCHYAGSRYHDDAPMNVTALKAMIKHWKPMMIVLLAVRGELRRRLALSAEAWTVGELHLLAGVVLSIPAFQLMTAGGSPAPLDPVLSSLFRITDGIRMTTHLMLFLSEERTRHPSEPVTGAELYGFTERNGLFLSGVGVCAGPRPLIDELLTTLFDGTPVEGADHIVLPTEVRAVLARLPAAVDYALLGLQVWSVSRSLWLAMSRAYHALREVLETAVDPGECESLRARLRADRVKLDAGRIGSEHERDVHLTVYADLYEQCWRALRAPFGTPDHPPQIAPCPETAIHPAAAGQLRERLCARAPALASGAAPAVDRIVDILIYYLREEQAILGSTTALQSAINTLVGRTSPTRPLTARDLRVHITMYGGTIAESPYLFDTLDDELGVRAEATASTITVTAGGQPRARPDPRWYASTSDGL